MAVREATWFAELKRRWTRWLTMSAAVAAAGSQESVDRLLEQDAAGKQPLSPWMLYSVTTAKNGWMRLDERLAAGSVQRRSRLSAARDVIPLIAQSPLIRNRERQDLEDDLHYYGAHVFQPAGDGISIADARCPLIVVGSEPTLHVLYLERPVYLGGRYEQLPQILLALLTPDPRTHAHLSAKLRLALSDDRVREALVKRVAAAELLAALKGFEERMAAYDLTATPAVA